jgi:hydroxyacylglutathione hydrolase
MKNTPIPLEDDPCDVMAKAMRGHGLCTQDLANRCGLPHTIITQALSDTVPTINAQQLRTIALELNLSPQALASLSHYKPEATPPKELIQIVTDFGHAGVNSFFLTHGSSATLFDAGTSAAPLISFLKQNNLELDAIYITHGHHDHLGGLEALPNTPTFFPGDITHGAEKALAPNIRLTALETSGHFTPSLAYFIEGLERPLCICGDIIFAGSMGKSPDPKSYQQSLTHATNNIMTLPSNTLLCPGHGPLTTITQESANNPFLADHSGCKSTTNQA